MEKENTEKSDTPEWSDFRDEIRKVQRGVKVMWFINFVFLSLVINAGLIVAFLDAYASTEELLTTLVFTTGASLAASLVIMAVAVSNSRRFIAQGLGSTTTEVDQGKVYDAVEEMSIASGVKMPKVYIDNSNVMNAYALGDNKGNSYVAFTEPLVNAMNHDELVAIAAHELAHIQSGDSPSMVKLITLSSMISLVSSIGIRMMIYGGGKGRGGRGGGGNLNPVAIALIIISIVFLVMAPLIAKIGNAFMSRQRETRADNLAVKYTRDPSSLASALMKIDQGTRNATHQSNQAKQDVKQFNNAIGALAFYKPSFIGKAFATHPPTEERIENLRSMGANDADIEELNN